MKKRSFKILSVFLMLTMFVSMLNIQAFAAISITLDKPTLKATAYTTPKIRLTWDSVKNANLYYIYRLEGEGDSLKYLTQTTGTTYDDKNIKYDVTYSYVIRAYTSKNGTLTAKSNISNLVESTVPNIQKVSTITATTVSDSKIKVAWNKVATAERYYLYYGEAGGTYKCIGYLPSKYTSYTFPNLKPNTTYWFKVKTTKNINGTNYTAGYSKGVSATTNKAQTNTTTPTTAAKTGEYTTKFTKISNKEAGLPTGSAITCLSMIMNYYGIENSPKDLLKYFKFLPYTKDNVYYDSERKATHIPDMDIYFVGDPTTNNTLAYGTGWYPLYRALRDYSKDHNENYNMCYTDWPDDFYYFKKHLAKGNISLCSLPIGNDKRKIEVNYIDSGKASVFDTLDFSRQCVIAFGYTDTEVIVYDPASDTVKYIKYSDFKYGHFLSLEF